MSVLKNLISNINTFTSLNGTAGVNHSSIASIKKVADIYKLIFRLFLYSVIGFFAKIVLRFFNRGQIYRSVPYSQVKK
ncbi:MAG: hypothetical protein HYY52_04655 [Candidatus Melainabacteria bacterium]|nr:hypothetical protein [Candidatus Melainabacteria bacterium]